MVGKILWYDDKVLKKVNDGSKKKILEACLLVEEDAKAICPVKTGELQRSITHKVEDTVGKVGSDKEYACVVELGSERGQRPQPYLRPSLHKNEKKILELFKNII